MARHIGKMTVVESRLHVMEGVFTAVLSFEQGGNRIDDDGIRSATRHAFKMFREIMAEKGYTPHVWPPNWRVDGNADHTVALFTLGADLRTLKDGKNHVPRISTEDSGPASGPDN